MATETLSIEPQKGNKVQMQEQVQVTWANMPLQCDACQGKRGKSGKYTTKAKVQAEETGRTARSQQQLKTVIGHAK